MEITKDTKIVDILNEYPWLPKKAKEVYPELEKIDTPLGRMMAKKLTLADAAKLGNIDVQKIVDEINFYVEEYKKEEEKKNQK